MPKITETFITSKYEQDIIEQFVFYDDDTAILQWMYDGVGEEDTAIRKVLMVRLTLEETKLIMERDRSRVGILEPVRKKMMNPDAQLMFLKRAAPYTFMKQNYTIPQDLTEEEFLEQLDTHHTGFEVINESKRAER